MMSFVLRTTGNPSAVVARARRAMSLVDGSQPLANIRTMDDALASSIGRPTVETQVLGTFGVVALLLAAFGIYALVAFSVAQRMRELGIRIALGADPASLGRAVIGHGVGLAADRRFGRIRWCNAGRTRHAFHGLRHQRA